MKHRQSPSNHPGRGNPRQQQGQAQESTWKQKFNPDWIRKAITHEAISFSEEFGKELTQGFTTNQIRNFFGEVRRIQMKGIEKEKTAFLLLKPKLAYAAKRAEQKGDFKAKDFREVMEAAHSLVMEKENSPTEFSERFANFIDFFEAILAYHKAYGGK
jgi:CRISPR-associated protein Csm2